RPSSHASRDWSTDDRDNRAHYGASASRGQGFIDRENLRAGDIRREDQRAGAARSGAQRADAQRAGAQRAEAQRAQSARPTQPAPQGVKKKILAQHPMMAKRLNIVIAILVVVTMALVGRLAWVQIVWGPELSAQAEDSARACMSNRHAVVRS